MRNIILLITVIASSTASAQEATTICIEGLVRNVASSPDPLGLGEDFHEFTASITLGPADYQDVNLSIERADYRSFVREVAIDGVPLPTADRAAFLSLRDRVDNATDSVVLFFWLEDFDGNEFALSFGFNFIPPETFTFTEPYEPFVPFPTTTIVSQLNSSAAGANWTVLPGGSIHVSSEGCDPPTVVELIEKTAELTAEINLGNGLSNALDSKLANALDAWTAENADDRQDVLHKLESFINAVEAQRDKKIANVDADELIAAAEEIIALILLSD